MLGNFLFFARRGQVSAEMLILTAAIVALALLLVTQLQSTAGKSSQVLTNKSEVLIEQINSIS